MRRLAACLVIATLLVALVPSATLSGKPPPPKVLGAMVHGFSDPVSCSLRLIVSYEGRAKKLFISNGTNIPGNTNWAVDLDRSGVVVTYDTIPLSYLNGTVTWSMHLTDGKLKPVSDILTVTEHWGVPDVADACPAPAFEIGRAP